LFVDGVHLTSTSVSAATINTAKKGGAGAGISRQRKGSGAYNGFNEPSARATPAPTAFAAGALQMYASMDEIAAQNSTLVAKKTKRRKAAAASSTAPLPPPNPPPGTGAPVVMAANALQMYASKDELAARNSTLGATKKRAAALEINHYASASDTAHSGAAGGVGTLELTHYASASSAMHGASEPEVDSDDAIEPNPDYAGADGMGGDSGDEQNLGGNEYVNTPSIFSGGGGGDDGDAVAVGNSYVNTSSVPTAAAHTYANAVDAPPLAAAAATITRVLTKREKMTTTVAAAAEEDAAAAAAAAAPYINEEAIAAQRQGSELQDDEEDDGEDVIDFTSFASTSTKATGGASGKVSTIERNRKKGKSVYDGFDENGDVDEYDV
jgi:hypothetical protein